MSDDGLLKLCFGLASLALALLLPMVKWLVAMNNRLVETDSRGRGLQNQMAERQAEIHDLEEGVEARRQAHDTCREQIVVRLGAIDGKLAALHDNMQRLLRINGVKPKED